MQHHKYSLTELENMMPWEREVYIGLLSKYIKDENERIERENAKNKTVERYYYERTKKIRKR